MSSVAVFSETPGGVQTKYSLKNAKVNKIYQKNIINQTNIVDQTVCSALQLLNEEKRLFLWLKRRWWLYLSDLRVIQMLVQLYLFSQSTFALVPSGYKKPKAHSGLLIPKIWRCTTTHHDNLQSLHAQHKRGDEVTFGTLHLHAEDAASSINKALCRLSVSICSLNLQA